MSRSVNTGIINKHDTQANWDRDDVTFVPKLGEFIVYDIDSNFNYERVKMGDGVNVPKNLPFVGGSIQLKSWTSADVTE